MNECGGRCAGAAGDGIDWETRARAEMDRKTKPPGSLGRLEEVAIRLAKIQGTDRPVARPARILLFAADHGVTAEGISPYPSSVTAQMVTNFLGGGAAICVLARQGAIGMRVIDVGVGAAWGAAVLAHPDFAARAVRAGSANLAVEPAMSCGECDAAMGIGRDEVRAAVEAGARLLGIGEMGIGNTTSAAALCAGLFGIAPVECVGRGAGAGDGMVARKVDVVGRALALHGGCEGLDARGWLERVGGLEIAAMAGAIVEAWRLGVALVIDGFIATAAAAVAFGIEPGARENCFFAHRSDERGHRRVLEILGVEPLLDLGMRLGEGTGAALAMHLIDAGARLLCEMATFESAGVSGRRDPGDGGSDG